MKQDAEKYKRTHTCGALARKDSGGTVTLAGWINRRRDLGGLIFIDLRDRHGMTQVVFNPQQNEEVFRMAENLKAEYVIAIKGTVTDRPEGTCNRNLATGEIEVHATELSIINPSKVPPFNMAEGLSLDETLRLKYRYLDLRRPGMVARMVLRHRAAKVVRDYFDGEGFLEIETPMLVRSTPEGARDYLVPSRVNQGKFYALPQSPQLFKQLLMVGGIDRYFQIARCFRDEDLRADRQPEFTQIDMEMSFVTREDVFDTIERMLFQVFEKAKSVELQTPFPRISYTDAINRYGTDKPDLRFGMEITDITSVVSGVKFEVFEKTREGGGKVKAIKLPGHSHLSRKEIEELVNMAKTAGLSGLLTIAFTPGGVKSFLTRFIDPECMESLRKAMGAVEGDLLLIAAGETAKVSEGLGKLRLDMAAKYKLKPVVDFSFLWVVDFPLYKFNAEENRIEAEHHPFTSPLPEDVHLMDTDPLKVRANAYDIVLNGVELGSGSVRIHNREMQEKVFRITGISEEEAYEKFGFLLSAFEFGAPPHGGIALGLDRLVAIMAGTESIREVLAFPKNQSAICPLTGAPVEATPDQLKLLKISVCEPSS
ncbi:MAG: aspartate--tRNA ligase [Candidatus Eremiobacteraeota bacterium]|nr:aspartate--tRNA ligase [Candidatus Eremiobacteraeota bacterium]